MCTTMEAKLDTSQIADVHRQIGCLGVKRTQYFVRSVDPSAWTEVVKSVVRKCEACQSNAPMSWEKNWSTLTMDITHDGSRHFLTLINCSLSWFVLWWLLHQQDSASVVFHLESVFYEQGSPIELLKDNDTAFICKQFKKFLKDWGVHLWFWWAYASARNDLVERSHRSIKTIVARKQCFIPEVVYWYNITPKDSLSPATAPANAPNWSISESRASMSSPYWTI